MNSLEENIRIVEAALLTEIFKMEKKDEQFEKECYTMQRLGIDSYDQLILLVDRMDLHFND